jgi:hypothetical protein
MYTRLERDIGTASAQALWDRYVVWLQGRNVHGASLQFTLDDHMHITADGRTTSFLRIEGNGPNATLGHLESLGGEVLSGRIAEIAALLSEGVIRTTPKVAGLPLTVYVRSLFFEEMLRISRHYDGDLSKLAESLANAGWGFAGREDAWDTFLRTRADGYEFDRHLADLGAKPFDRTHWEIGNWKHARALAKKSDGAERWNPTAVSLHFATFLGLAADMLVREKMAPDAAAVDHLCARSLGLPAPFGTPHRFIQRRGRRRIAYYAAAHWPVYQFDVSAP